MRQLERGTSAAEPVQSGSRPGRAPEAGGSGGNRLVAAPTVAALQRTAGNRAVQGLMDGAAPTVQRKPAKRADQTANLARLTKLRDSADAQFTLASDYAAEALAVGDLAKEKLSTISTTYTTAYDTFRGVLNAAQLEAQNQQQWTDVVVGVICGTVAGLAAAFVLPSTAAGWFSLTLAEAGTAALSSAGQGVLSGGIAMLASKATGVEGKVISSEGLQPAFQELAMWRKVSQIYRSGLEVNPLIRASHLLSGNLANAIADVRVYAAGGNSTLTDKAVGDAVVALETADAQQVTARDDLKKKVADLQALHTAVAAINPQARTARQMERDIWILWMSSLARNSNILDLDAIEDHIGPKGLGIIDFGMYTSDADENEAIEDAKNTAQQMQAAATNTDVPANPPAQLKILTR